MIASATPMLIIHVSQIPHEGLPVSADLVPEEVHVAGEESFALRPGGSLKAQVERGDEESVHVRGRLAARLGLQCNRCLEPFELPVDQELDLFYLPHRSEGGADEEEEEVELSDRDMVVAFYRDGRLDLGQMVREQFFLALPMKRLCRDDCAGLCPTCGVNRNEVECDCPDEPADPRLLPLRKLLE
ncbi:MAG TPA: DUF177 domain-containing protein [Vicinamibacteria bacterium]|nr:DUF177 domain-containing protein [Vicinamibacteria bacterium]